MAIEYVVGSLALVSSHEYLYQSLRLPGNESLGRDPAHHRKGQWDAPFSLFIVVD